MTYCMYAIFYRRIPEIRSEPVLNEMVQIIASKLKSSGKVIPESIYLAWKDWDFGQKKEPSAWLTFLVHRILLQNGDFITHSTKLLSA